MLYQLFSGRGKLSAMTVVPKYVSILFVVALQNGLLPADTTDQRRLDFFESRIRPVLVEHCYACHSASAKKLKGELLLDSRWGWQQGGESGPPIVPGSPEESLIIDALRYESFEMPPKAKLPDSVISDFVRWIKDGAVDPREKQTPTAESHATFDLAERRKWWSLQPVPRRGRSRSDKNRLASRQVRLLHPR